MQHRKPAAIRIANGDYYRPSRHGTPSDGPSLPPLNIADVPDFLSDDGRKQWQRIGPPLVGAGVLTEVDRDLFAAYCAEWSFYLEAIRNIAKQGMFPINKKNKKESEHCNKWRRVADAALRNVIRIGPLLGLTPVDRGKVCLVESPRPQLLPDVRPRSALDRLHAETDG